MIRLLALAASLVLALYRPAPAKRAVTTPKNSPGRWARFFHIATYFINDSGWGVREAFRKGYSAIDLNFHVTKDGVIVNTHWSKPLLHGFTWDAKTPAAWRALPKSIEIKDLTWAQVKHLVARKAGKTYRIRTFAYMARLCARLGLRMEFETKNSPGFLDPRIWATVESTAKALGLNIQVKAESWVAVRGKAVGIFRAVKAGSNLTTIILPRGTRRVSRSAWDVIDYHRGPVVWFGKVRSA